jgi:hypothetical protein
MRTQEVNHSHHSRLLEKEEGKTVLKEGVNVEHKEGVGVEIERLRKV